MNAIPKCPSQHTVCIVHVQNVVFMYICIHMSEYTIVAALPCSAIFPRNIMLHTVLYTQKRRNLDVKKGSQFRALMGHDETNFCQKKISPACKNPPCRHNVQCTARSVATGSLTTKTMSSTEKLTIVILYIVLLIDVFYPLVRTYTQQIHSNLKTHRVKFLDLIPTFEELDRSINGAIGGKIPR
jgi:hypothetical protein